MSITQRLLQAQTLDSGNSVTVSSADAAPGSPWVGAWINTRLNYFVRQLTVLASNVASGLGGTFTFEYGEGTPSSPTVTVSESRVIGSFSTVRDFDLINAGAIFRVKFEPSRVMTGGESVFITTTQRRIYDGQFVRLLNQSLEETNLTLPHSAVFLKGMTAAGVSQNCRVTTRGNLISEEYTTTLPTYAASVTGLVPAAAATDIFTIYGSASKTIRITRLESSGIASTAGSFVFSLIKRSSVNTLGTSTAVTRVPNDSANVAATATVLAYTASPTVLGTTVGGVRAQRVFMSTPTLVTHTPPTVLVWEFGTAGQNQVLRGVGEGLALNLGAATVIGGLMNISVEWLEE